MVKNFNYMFVANILSALCKFLILLVIVRLGTPEDVGRYNYALVITAPIFLFISLKIRSVIVTNDKYSPNEYVSAIFSLNIITLIFVAIFVYVLGNGDLTTILIVSLIKLFENMKEVPYGIYQKNENLKLLGISMGIYNILSLIFFYIIYSFSHNLNMALLFLVISCIFSFAIIDRWYLSKYYNIKLHYNNNIVKFKEIFILAIPLAFSSALGSLNTGIPRIVLENLFGKYTLGIFSTIAYVLVIGGLFANSISQVFLPKLRKLYKDENKIEFEKLTRKMVFIGIFIGMCSVILSLSLGEAFLSLLFGKEYGENNTILIILSFGLLFILSGIFLGTTIISTGKYNVNYKISLILLFCILIFSFLLIPKYSLLGAALTITISQFVALISYYYFYKRIF
ncbi:flippase [Staphylococcus nepalensis]|uniref:flippase n=1 Tax=Staphylococcus nepalensis TaxID=214473 RepID=UPI001E48EA19|nr:flippase [Staphylococcus nepalensis]MCD8892239.1 flippase [Staphylococcus nepalensis]